MNPTVPSGATSFSVVATYKGGYSTSKSGTVVQVDLVPNFSLTPNPVLKGANLTLKNLMQIGAAATVTSVDYAITPGGGSGTLAPAFNAVNGQATVTAPGTVGSYTITLTWHYTVAGVPKTAVFSLPFSTTDFNPNPVLSIYTNADHTGAPIAPTGSPLTFYLQTGATYYLFDDESVPGGVHPGASFWKSGDQLHSISSGDTQLPGSPTSGYGPATFLSTSACNSGCYFKVEVPASGGVVNASRYVVSGRHPAADADADADSGGQPDPRAALAREPERRPDRDVHGDGERLRPGQLLVGLRRLGSPGAAAAVAAAATACPSRAARP